MPPSWRSPGCSPRRCRPRRPEDSRGSSTPAETLDRPPERRQDLRGQRVRAEGGGARRFPSEGGANDRRTAPRTVRIVGWGDEPEADLEAAGVLENHAGQAAGERGPQAREGWIGRRPGRGREIDERG